MAAVHYSIRAFAAPCASQPNITMFQDSIISTEEAWKQRAKEQPLPQAPEASIRSLLSTIHNCRPKLLEDLRGSHSKAQVGNECCP